MFQRLLITALALVLTAMPAQAQSGGAEDTAAIAEAMRGVLAGFESEAGFRGATVAVRLPDGQVVTAVHGYADRELEIAMRPDHRLLGGSIGKTFVAATLMGLVEEGRVSLDDRAADYAGGKDWFDPLPNAATVTLGQLLNHSSGIPMDYFETEPMREVLRISAEEGIDIVDQGVTHEDLLRPLGGMEPAFEAGTDFRYSDANYTVIALIIERVTGVTLEAEVERRFIDPLGLADTERQYREMPRLTAAYTDPRYAQVFPGVPPKAGAYERLTYDPGFEWGGGGWVFTATDLAQWGQAWFGGTALDTPYLDTLRASLNHHPMDRRGWSYGLGLQWVDDETAGERWYHGGYDPGFIAKVEYRPEADMTLAVMFNTIDRRYEAIADALWVAVQAELAD